VGCVEKKATENRRLSRTHGYYVIHYAATSTYTNCRSVQLLLSEIILALVVFSY